VLLDNSMAGASYLWSDGSSNATLTVSSSGQYWVEVTLNGCAASDTVNIDVLPPIVVDLGADIFICPGGSATLDAALSGYSFLWNGGQTTSSITVSTAGTYWVQAGMGSCTGSDTIVVQQFPEVLVDLGSDQAICPGEIITLDAGNPGATYIWSNGETNQTSDIFVEGQISVLVTMNGCTGEDDIYISMLEDPVVSLGDDEVLCEGNTKVLYAAFPGASYLWQDGSVNEYYYVTASGLYAVGVSNQCGTVTDSVFITMIDCNCSVFIPNSFTPAQDNMNDIFVPISTCGWKSFDLKIYDRWGKLLFESQDETLGWDGFYHGEQVPQGVYTYIFHYIKDTRDNIKEVAYGFIVVLPQN
jgi:gliding motility-associated-like protein